MRLKVKTDGVSSQKGGKSRKIASKSKIWVGKGSALT